MICRCRPRARNTRACNNAKSETREEYCSGLECGRITSAPKSTVGSFLKLHQTRDLEEAVAVFSPKTFQQYQPYVALMLHVANAHEPRHENMPERHIPCLGSHAFYCTM
jgi:hypothetical protein